MKYFITGTDTGVGKSVVAAWLMLHINASYWKPIQAGTLVETDEQFMRRVTQSPDHDFWPSSYIFPKPLSPHEAAKRAGQTIDMDRFKLPQTKGPLIVEGAGGVLVPLNERALMIDLMCQLDLPVILVTRSTLGTINHTLLSLESLRARGLKIAGVILNGPPHPHNSDAIETYGKVKVIAQIAPLHPLTRETLRSIKPLIDLTTLQDQ